MEVHFCPPREFAYFLFFCTMREVEDALPYKQKISLHNSVNYDLCPIKAVVFQEIDDSALCLDILCLEKDEVKIKDNFHVHNHFMLK